MPLPPTAVEPPAHADLALDLGKWRASGVLKLRQLTLPALSQAAMAAGFAENSKEATQPPVVIDLVRRALSTVAGSVTGRTATVLLGLDPNTFDLAPHLLREEAAEIYGVSRERFRREPQTAVLETVADLILELCFAHRARLARLSLEQRQPADTRLAIHWLERFEAYFRIWTPVYALGADLTAYRETLIQSDQQWEHLIEKRGEPQYTRKMQADGYAQFALFHFAAVLSARQHFMVRYGGLWLLSSATAEVNARDALQGLISPTAMNERDHSWLQIQFNQAAGEMHDFIIKLKAVRVGTATLQEWADWVDLCNCRWAPRNVDPTVEYFPSARYNAEIDSDCLVHQTVESANRFCTIIENEWLKIADWYGGTPIPVDNTDGRDHKNAPP